VIDVRNAVRPRVVVPAVVAVAALVAGGLAGVLVGLGLALGPVGRSPLAVARQLGAASIDAEVVELHVAQAEAR
jgi:hypothetical protein